MLLTAFPYPRTCLQQPPGTQSLHLAVVQYPSSAAQVICHLHLWLWSPNVVNGGCQSKMDSWMTMPSLFLPHLPSLQEKLFSSNRFVFLALNSEQGWIISILWLSCIVSSKTALDLQRKLWPRTFLWAPGSSCLVSSSDISHLKLTCSKPHWSSPHQAWKLALSAICT